MLFLKLSKLDIAIGRAIAVTTTLGVSIICRVLGQALTQFYVR